MSKIYGFIAAGLVATLSVISISAPARADVNTNAVVTQIVQSIQTSAFIQAHSLQGLDWRVGDKVSMKISNMMINGTIDGFVREDTGTSYWMQQDANLSMMGKQKIEVLMNKTTGAIEKMLINGKEEKAPAPNVEVLEMKEDHITVAAGSFDCIYAKIKNKDDGKISQAWLNPKLIPMSGTLKAIAESQLGEIVQELTSFQFAAR